MMARKNKVVGADPEMVTGFGLASVKKEGCFIDGKRNERKEEDSDNREPVTELTIRGDYIYFTTGKRMYAHSGIIGLTPDGIATEGYDGSLVDIFDDKGMTAAERAELAEHMIKKWQAFGNRSEG